MINSNIGCIETIQHNHIQTRRYLINSNIGCIETPQGNTVKSLVCD